MRLVLLVILVACQRQPAEPCVIASADEGALAPRPAIAPKPASCPPPVTCPPPAPPAPAPAAAGVSIEALLQGLYRFEPERPYRGFNPYFDSVQDALRSADPANPDQIVPAVNAVIAEPGDVPARFMLACTLAQHGLHERARRELQRLVEAKRCPACVDALANVADPFCGFDDKAKELVAAVKPPPLHTAAVQILASLNSGDPSKIERYLEGTAVLDNHCGVCDRPMSTKTAMSRAQLITFVRGAEERIAKYARGYTRPLLLFCDGRCCSGPSGYANHSAVMVTSICFRGPADAPKLESITSVSG
jgi:hypothetical protein